ncbi:hypothetical protein HRbin18_02289 [bacterium HR18]|nr:hypothetical protein HRbin18_02289 [bacterium HR18]
MKTMITIIGCGLLMLGPMSALAQQAGDYRSATNGNWSDAATWEVFDGATWSAATNAPVGSEHITVRHTVTIDVPVTISGYLKVESGGEVTVGSGSLSFGEGSVYEHARDGGSVPLADWGEGSTVVFSGITANAPANRGQDYYHLVLNTPGLTANRDLGLHGRRIRGDIRVLSTGSGRWQLVGGVSDTVWVFGDVVVEGGQFTVQGTSSATHVVVEHYGDVVVRGGNFSIARGSQGGVGTTKWVLHEGDFWMSNAQTQNSNPTVGNAKFVFAKAGVQRLVLGEGNTIIQLPVEVLGGTTLDMGLSELGGSGIFVLNDSATLATAHPEGVAGALKTTGLVQLSKRAGFVFNGQEAQVVGALLPDTVAFLGIANPVGVSVADTHYVDALQVGAGAKLIVEGLGVLRVKEGEVLGYVVNQGALEAEAVLSFGEGSVYEHARDGGSVPLADWGEGSTVVFSGITANAPANRGQDYYHLVLNTPGLTANRDLGLHGRRIRGDIRVLSTGSGRWQLVGGVSDTVWVFGDVVVEGGQFTVQGTSSATHVVVEHYGDVVVRGGNFSIARGSQGGVGTTKWVLHEGDFWMSNAQTQNSNPTVGNAKFVFAKAGVQRLVLGEGNTIIQLPVEVLGGTTLDMGLSELGGSGIFVLNDSATLATAHPEGVAGALKTTGTVTLSSAANFVFNGTVAQETSTLMPTVVNDLVIDNEAGVKLSQETTINGVLRLVAGEFDNTIPFTLGPNGTISYEGGRLKVPFPPVATERTQEIPTQFALYTGYPNPFAHATNIRYDVAEPSRVIIKIYDVTGREVAELVHRDHLPGTYTVQWRPEGLASGLYYCQLNAGTFQAVRTLVLTK